MKNWNLILKIEKCEICIEYKRTKPQPAVGFPLAKTFNETVAIDLKEWSYDKKNPVS